MLAFILFSKYSSSVELKYTSEYKLSAFSVLFTRPDENFIKAEVYISALNLNRDLPCSISRCAAIKCFSVHKKLQSEHSNNMGISFESVFSGISGMVKIGAEDESLIEN